jgi:hypothetical protein
MCLICTWQFIVDLEKQKVKYRPGCLKCGKNIYCYMKEPDKTKISSKNYFHGAFTLQLGSIRSHLEYFKNLISGSEPLD